MTTLEAPDGRGLSVLATPQEVISGACSPDGVVVVVSTDCIAAVDAVRKAQGRAGVFIGSTQSPALAEMQAELYDAR